MSFTNGINLIFNQTLFITSLPYIGFTAYDLWMHKHDREVPKLEKIFHGIILPCVIIFLVTAILNYNYIAIIALAITFPCMIIDELVYHQRLHIKERRIHMLAGFSFISFVAYWAWTIY